MTKKRLGIIGLLIFTLAAAVGAFAQSNQPFVQKELWASDYGTWQIKGSAPNTYQWQPSSLCQFPIPGGTGNFDAPNSNAPVYIMDANNAQSEVVTPSFVILNSNLCEVAMVTSYNHFSFSLASGTAGLQEALNSVPAPIPYAVQVFLDRNWYTMLASIPGRNPASVIAAAKGSTAANLVDVTTVPATYYHWNGSQYVATGTGGAVGSVFGRTGAVTSASGDYTVSQVTGAAPLASPALTGTPTAPTATSGTNTTQLATTAFVLASGGGPPTGTAGGALAGNYPNPSLAAQAANTLLGNNTGSSAAPAALTISQVASLLGLGTAASQPSTAFDAAGAAAAAQAASAPSTCTNGSYACSASPTLTGTPAAPTATTGTNTTQVATTQFVQSAVAASTAGVSSFNTRTGAVVANSGDYTVGQVTGAAPLASPTFTGTPTAPTQAISTNNTDIATTAAVSAAIPTTLPPSGAAGGSLSGTYPNPALAPCIQTINGVSYSACYPQTTLVARINAACNDALNLTNGNTSHKCDSTGEADVQTDTTGSTIAIGNSSGTQIVWIHPPVCHWRLSGYSGGTADLVDLYGGSSIEGPSTVNNTCEVFYTGGTNGAYAVFQTITPSTSNTYFKVKGMGFMATSASLASGATTVFNSTSDGSVFEDLLIANYEPGQSAILLNDAQSYGQCCTTTFNRIVAGGNYQSGPILTIVANGTNNQSSVEFTNVSLTHPAPGYPIISCSSTNADGESLYFDNLYEEANKNDTTTPINQMGGCLAIKVSGMTVSDPGATTSSSAPVWKLFGSSNISFDLSGLTVVHGFVAPAIAVQNSITGYNCALTPCNVYTDANGNLGHYTNGVFQGDLINASVGFEVGGAPLIPSGYATDLMYATTNKANSGLSRLQSNLTYAAQVPVSVLTPFTAVPTTKTCSHFSNATSANSSCTWSTSPVAGETIACQVTNQATATFSITDSSGDTYTAYGGVHNGATGIYTQTFYTLPIANNPVTTTAATLASGTGAGFSITCNTVPIGIVTTTPTDGQCTADTTITGSTTSLACSSAITTTANGDYIFCGAAASSGSAAFTAGSGFTLGSVAPSGNNFVDQYQVQATAGSIMPSIGLTGSSGTASMVCSAFKAGGNPTLTLSSAPAISAANMTNFPATGVSSFNSRTGAVTSASGDYTVSQVTGAAPLASPALTGTPTAPTQAISTNNTDIATTSAVQTAINALSFPVTTVFGRSGSVVAVSGDYAVGQVTGAAPLASPAFTGTPTAPTAAAGTNTTQVATTAYLQTSFAAPPAIGSTTPAAGSFSSVTDTGALAMSSGQCINWNGDTYLGRTGADALVLGPTCGNGGGTLTVGTVSATSTGSFGNAQISGLIQAQSVTGNTTLRGGQNGASTSSLGSVIVQGGTNSSTGAGGNASLQAGANSSTGNQGFANVQQSFTIGAATTVGFVMSMTTTADKVVASPLASNLIVGIAASVGGTNAQLYVVLHGKTLVVFDGTPVIGDIACGPPASTGTIGLAHDNGTTSCTFGQGLGIITGQVSGTGSGSTATVLVQIAQ